jgi:rubredoxin
MKDDRFKLFPKDSFKENAAEIIKEMHKQGTGALLRGLAEEEALYSPYPIFHPAIFKGWKVSKELFETANGLYVEEMVQRWQEERLTWAFSLFPALFSRYGDFMKCPECGGEMYFFGSSTWVEDKRVIRRYRCRVCKHVERTENEFEEV